MSCITLETFIQAGQDLCFRLSLDAGVHQRSVAHTGEIAVAGRGSGQFELGDTVVWEARHLGFRQRLEVQITALDAPGHFRDEMLRGAFRSMRHDHYFDAQQDGTLMRDVFCYEVPLGMAGRLFDRMYLRRYMRRLLEQRNAYIRALAEAAQEPSGR